MSEVIVASKEGYPYPEGISFNKLQERAVVSERDRSSFLTAEQSDLEIQRVLVQQIFLDRLNIPNRQNLAKFLGRSVLHLTRCYQTRYVIFSMQDSLLFLGAAVASGFPAELMASLWLNELTKECRTPSANLVRKVFETTTEFQSEGVSGNIGALMNFSRAFEYYPLWRDLGSWQNFVYLLEQSFFGNTRNPKTLTTVLKAAFGQLALSRHKLHSLGLYFPEDLKPHEIDTLIRFNLDLARVLHCLALFSTSLNIDLTEAVGSVSYFDYLHSIGIGLRDILLSRFIERK